MLGLSNGIWANRSGGLVGPHFLFRDQLLGVYKFYSSGVVLNYQDGTGEQLTNPGFEAGSPPTGWPGGSGGTPTSRAGSLGGGGSQHIRVTITNPDTVGYVIQAAVVAGARYYVSGFARGDGINGAPRITTGGGSDWTGTTSNSIQAVSAEFTAGPGGNVLLITDGNNGTVDYAEWDSMSVVERPGIVTVPNDPILAARNTRDYSDPFHLGQATAANQAWLHPTGWNGQAAAQFRAANSHFMQVDTMAPRFTGADQPWFMLAAVDYISAPADQRLFSLGNSADNNPAHDLRNSTARYTSQRTDDVPATKTSTGAVAGVPASRHIIAARFDGQNLWTWIDGVADAVSDDLDLGAMTVDQVTVACLRRVANANFANAYVRELLLGMNATNSAMVAGSNLLATFNP